MSVDLPAPFSPMRLCTSPARRVKSTPSRARTPGNWMVIPRISMMGATSLSTGMCRYFLAEVFRCDIPAGSGPDPLPAGTFLAMQCFSKYCYRLVLAVRESSLGSFLVELAVLNEGGALDGLARE